MFLPQEIEVVEVALSSKEALMQIADARVPTVVSGRKISATVMLARVPFQVQRRRGASNLQALRSARRTAETTRLLDDMSPNPSLSHLKLEKETKAYKRTYHGPGPSPHPRIPAPRNSRLAALLPVG